MNEQEIQKLLRQYFDGKTSLEEENQLNRFFAREDVPESLKKYQPLFAFFSEERAIDYPEQKSRKIKMPWMIITGIAASLAILFLVSFPRPQHNEYIYYVDGERVYDEAAAIESAENKLQLLAESMQKAKNSMAAFEKIQESNQSLQQLSKLQMAFDHVEKALSEASLKETH
ncbi:MAG: hypothetical protein LBQ60_15720 [Bacteroidales bacterium]|jgi:hypothetical protein|nr:hypothetical protein [Bacteroidales bacterium]